MILFTRIHGDDNELETEVAVSVDLIQVISRGSNGITKIWGVDSRTWLAKERVSLLWDRVCNARGNRKA